MNGGMSSSGDCYKSIDYTINYRSGSEKRHVCVIYFSDYNINVRDISLRHTNSETLADQARNKIDEFHKSQERKAGMPKFIAEYIIRDANGEIDTRLLHGLNLAFRRSKYVEVYDYEIFLVFFDPAINKKYKKVTKVMINHGKDSASMSYRGISLKAPSS